MSSPSSELKNVAEVNAVSEGNSAFSSDLHGVLREVHAKNLIFSPFSLSTVIAMVKLGARGATSDQLVNCFKFPAEDDLLSKGYSQVLSSFKEENEGYTLSAANNVYAQTGFGINADYSTALKNSFGVEIEQLDFAQNVEAAARINEWVEKVTRDKITNLIPADALNALTRLVLVNGVYFKGSWANKFDPQDTSEAPFYINEEESVNVQMMSQESKFPVAEIQELESIVLNLPYQGDRLSMLIFLPNSRTGLSKVEAGLKDFPPSTLIPRLQKETVVVSLPKFKIESTLSLVQPLQKLGLSMFGDAADFSGIPESGDRSLFVSEVVQKAFIEVNEEGSEAAAATGVVMMLRCMPIVTHVRCDHPFLFQIVDKHTNFVLFTGVYTSPNN